MATELLHIQGLDAGYGKIQALWGIDLAVHERETVVLVGPNGAGKTTLIRTLMGLLRQWHGDLVFAGESIAHRRTDQRVRAGIAYMSEVGCFPDMSVDDNLLIGAQFLPRSESKRQVDELYQRFPTLQEKRKALGGSLSGGQRKILGVAKALASKPRLLVMDEPSAGLSPVFVNDVIRALQTSREAGLALLVAAQNVKFLDIAERVYTLEGGRIGFVGTVPEMHADAALQRAYFGLHARHAAPAPNPG
ncbi:MAG: ABC transporter ATP-binding protein [Burkholderiaceae bacterium]|nr:MAG: ABC transporter ATP-binding protein [Burkholderiaceae bacterium]